jgi:hypothetical protein
MLYGIAAVNQISFSNNAELNASELKASRLKLSKLKLLAAASTQPPARAPDRPSSTR